MKKKLLSALLCLVLALTLLPTAALAAPTRLKSVDLVIDLPKAGDPNEMETEVTIKSMKSGNIDLLANGAGILYTDRVAGRRRRDRRRLCLPRRHDLSRQHQAGL